MTIKMKIKKLVPVWLIATKNIVFGFNGTLLNYLYDLKKFTKYSLWNDKKDDKKTLQAKILLQTHIIEKGLSLKEPRPGFGRDKIDTLLLYLDTYKNKGYDTNNVYFRNAISVIEKYMEFQKTNSVNTEWIDEKLRSYKKLIDTHYEDLGGIIKLRRHLMPEFSKIPFNEFFNSRYSVRYFDDSDVDMEKVRMAVSLARKTPSACNRQAGKAYIVSNNAVRDKVAQLHKGIGGFGDQLRKFIIITSDIKCFGGVGERNQAYIDGGLFAMSVLMSLHYYNIASIPLHWGVERKLDLKLHKVVGIPDSEVVVMLIGIGNYPDEFNVAKSCRRDIEDVCIIV